MMTLFLLQEMALNEVLAFLQKSSIKVETSRTVEQFGEFKIFGGKARLLKKIMLFCISCKVQSKYSIEVIFIVCRSIQKNLIKVLMGSVIIAPNDLSIQSRPPKIAITPSGGLQGEIQGIY